MTLTVADIDRWDPAAVREVADAARGRARAAAAAAGGLAGLPCLTGWGGRAAGAAGAAIARTRRHLQAHALDAAAVAEAAEQAAEGIEALRADLRLLRIEAAALGLRIDAGDSRVVAVPGVPVPAMLRLVAVPLLQAQLNRIVAQADSLDVDLAAALGLGHGGAPSAPAPVEDPGPMPEDPAAFCARWRSLTRAQRDLLYARDPGIGNHPGMPAGTADDPGADHYNRRHLAADLAAARACDADTLPDLQALADALRDPSHTLLLYDPDSGERVHAAVAVGNPDTAAHVSVTTPGLNSTVRENMGRMVAEAAALRREALRQLDDADRDGEDVAAIAWIGYDAPQVPGVELLPTLPGLPAVPNPLSVARAQRGLYRVSHDDTARAAAPDLARFYDGIAAAHGGAPLNLTAIGHSYGSLVTGLALQQPGDHGVDSAIFYGSPGIEATTPADLGLPAGRVFVMATPDDPIRWVYDGPGLLGAAAPLTATPLDDAVLLAAQASGAGDFGPDPATNPAFVRLETGPMVLVEPDQPALHFDGARGHSDYPGLGSGVGPDGEPLLRTTGFNIAAVVSGLSGDAVRGD